VHNGTGGGNDAPVTSPPGQPVVDVVVEIPKGSRNKYEMDKATGVIRLDRRLFSATVYPADYGFIPDTLAGDGDPLDALVLLDDPTFPGCWVTARPVAVLWMEDDKGEDAKIVCVPAGDPRWEKVVDIDDVPSEYRAEIQHFFEVYKLIEPGKHSSTRGWSGADEAWREIEASRARHV
jgi:inorganic pyrophosphatase